MDAALVRCAAAVAVEDLAHVRHGNLNTPAVAFMCLALCDVRRVVVRQPDSDGDTWGGEDEVPDHPVWSGEQQEVDRKMSAEEAVRFLAVAPVNVASLAIDDDVPVESWHSIADALAADRCHGFMRRLDLPQELPIDASDAAALLAATNGLAHLRSLQCAGAGAGIVLDAVDGALRRLALSDCTAIAPQDVDFTRMPLLRCVGVLRRLPAGVTAIDLSQLQHLMRIGDAFAFDCFHVREVRLPPSVTSIGDHFGFRMCFAAALDLSHLTRLQRIGEFFACDSSLPGLRLPPSVTDIGDRFLMTCLAFTAVLDLSHLTQLRIIAENFGSYSSLPDLRLPPSVTSIGYGFLTGCDDITNERREALQATNGFPVARREFSTVEY
jgi:hypothetical protein